MLFPNIIRYAAGTTSASVTLTPDSDKRIYIDRIMGFNDKSAVIEVRNALSGTIAIANTSTTITGTGTLFLTELEPGDTIRHTDSGAVFVIASIASNTSLTTTVAAGSTDTSSAAVRLLAEFSTITNESISINVGCGLWGSYAKAVTVALASATADCALTVSAYHRS